MLQAISPTQQAVYNMPTTVRFRLIRAFGLAFLIEATALLVFLMLVPAKPKTEVSEPVPIVLSETEITKPEPLPETKPLPVLKPQLKAAAKPIQEHKAFKPEAQPSPELKSPEAPAPEVQTATDSTEPVTQPVAPQVSQVVNKSTVNLEYAAKVRAAVQAAVYYPSAAAALHFTGRVRVEFHLKDTVTAEAHVVESSNISMIDHAAIQAVQNAIYPAPPSDMAGNDYLYQVWVEFTRKS